jgi:hypothetical protein
MMVESGTEKKESKMEQNGGGGQSLSVHDNVLVVLGFCSLWQRRNCCFILLVVLVVLWVVSGLVSVSHFRIATPMHTYASKSRIFFIS